MRKNLNLNYTNCVRVLFFVELNGGVQRLKEQWDCLQTYNKFGIKLFGLDSCWLHEVCGALIIQKKNPYFTSGHLIGTENDGRSFTYTHNKSKQYGSSSNQNTQNSAFAHIACYNKNIIHGLSKAKPSKTHTEFGVAHDLLKSVWKKKNETYPVLFEIQFGEKHTCPLETFIWQLA